MWDWVAWDLYARFVTYRRVCCCDFQLEEEQSSGVRSSAGAWSKRSMTGCFSFCLTCCFNSTGRLLFFVKLTWTVALYTAGCIVSVRFISFAAYCDGPQISSFPSYGLVDYIISVPVVRHHCSTPDIKSCVMSCFTSYTTEKWLQYIAIKPEMDASPALRLRKSGHVSTTVHLCSLRYLAIGPFHRSLLQHRIWTTWTGEVAKHQQR